VKGASHPDTPSPGKREIARRAYEAITRRDLETLAELLAPGCEIVPLRAAVDRTVFRGPYALTEWWAAQDEVWDGLTAETESAREGPDWVLDFGRIRARGRTSGALLDVQAAVVYRFRGGLITSIRIYTDRAEALADLDLTS
jgi:ketosteroid isomerase-like protein